MGKKSVYESLITGLKEAIDDAKNENSTLKKHIVKIEKVKIYNPEDVKRISKETGMSQRIFASYLGVSNKTVEAWEAGTNHPSGAASRILNMMEMDKNLTQRFPFVSNVLV